MRGTEQAAAIRSIRLIKEGQWTVVEVDVAGLWVPVIRELTDNNFDHFVSATGILRSVSDAKRRVVGMI